MKTGIFFHPLMKKGLWPIIGNKFENFPEALEDVLKLPNVKLFTSEPVPEELLRKVHTEDHIERVKRAWYWQGAIRSVGGCVQAAEMIAKGELKNALVFAVAAGHHASPSSAWGGTYLSCIGPTVIHLRENTPFHSFAIIDTDCHHGDGTRKVFENDREVLHVCFCSENSTTEDGTKVDVDVGFRTDDERYLQAVEREFVSRAREFRPELIFHNFGHDTCDGDYGDRGLSPEFFPRLARLLKELADEICGGRYIVITHGGSRKDVAEQIFPEIARILAS